MTYVPVTPFRGTVTKTTLANDIAVQDAPALPRADKWSVLRELGVAGPKLGVSDRQLNVLQALLSFFPETDLGTEGVSTVVFPSNAAICSRLNGMACSTMRRHLSDLVRAGLLVRRDSPNGKRYRTRGGDPFGFDLAPLALRFAEICAVAEAVRAENEALQRLRQTVSLMRRDLAALVVYGAEQRPDQKCWDALSDLAILSARDLRRNLDAERLSATMTKLKDGLDKARNVLDAEYMSTTDDENEQHIQNSNTDIHDLEPCFEKAKGDVVDNDLPEPPLAEVDAEAGRDESDLPNIPLGLILSVCTQISVYSDQRLRHWHDLVRVADLVRPMMGISPSAWQEAMRAMGPEQAAVVVAAMLERFEDIKSPGGYLRHLSRRAEDGQFSCGPMVMALMRRAA